jgi:hypothetical protein
MKMTRREILEEMLAYLRKALAKSRDNLHKHQTGVWSSDPKYISQSEATVAKWERWVNFISAELDEN